MSQTIFLKCWTCGAEQACEIHQLQFAFELAAAARDVGWIGVIDSFNSRSLVFCSTGCLDAQTTKRGRIRKYPKRTQAPPA